MLYKWFVFAEMKKFSRLTWIMGWIRNKVVWILSVGWDPGGGGGGVQHVCNPNLPVRGLCLTTDPHGFCTAAPVR